MGKDLLTRPYGRFFYLAEHLVKLGHEVQLILYSYRFNENQQIKKKGLTIISCSLVPNPILTIYSSIRFCKKIKPDWIIGFSDTYYGIFACYVANKLGSKSLIDAYDNYESYMPYFKPLHLLWRKALSNATLVTCAGPSLEEMFAKYRKNKPIKIIPMAADPEFSSLKRNECRTKLKLPEQKKLIGYYGSISNTRDINILFSAFENLVKKDPDIILILSGRLAKNIDLPNGAIYLGYLADIDMPLFINSLDVLAVPNSPSSFGHYSYPVKLYEAMTCKVPVAVTKTMSTSWVLKEHQNFLVEPKNIEEFVRVINYALSIDRVEYTKLTSWAESGKIMEEVVSGF